MAITEYLTGLIITPLLVIRSGLTNVDIRSDLLKEDLYDQTMEDFHRASCLPSVDHRYGQLYIINMAYIVSTDTQPHRGLLTQCRFAFKAPFYASVIGQIIKSAVKKIFLLAETIARLAFPEQ